MTQKFLTIEQKLENFKLILEGTGCWEWSGTLNKDGYGRIVVGYKKAGYPIRAFVHRISYQITKGEIPDGFEIDHLCRNKCCFNPHHLDAVTKKENIRRGKLAEMMREKAASQTHCYKGHQLSGENLVLQGPEKKFRVCRICRAERQKALYHENRASILNQRKMRYQMKTFNRVCAQGDVMFVRIDAIPKNAIEVPPTNGRHIVTHSESGHDHIIAERPNVKLFTTGDPMISYLQVIEATDETEALLEHLRTYDTHETIKIAPGNYEIRRQREYSPEGWRRVED